jgi:putative SOS response-associated peptidase YedK
MCGRFSQGMSTNVLVKHFGAIDKRYREPEPSWNVAPLKKATVVVLEPHHTLGKSTGLDKFPSYQRSM